MYTLTPTRRRPAAARVERDWFQRVFGLLLYALLVGLTIWIAP